LFDTAKKNNLVEGTQARVVVSASCAPCTHHGAVSLRNIKYNLFLPILQKAHFIRSGFSFTNQTGKVKENLTGDPFSLFPEARICCIYFPFQIYIYLLVHSKTVFIRIGYRASKWKTEYEC
jgi:hypothetical protein